jgi:hypothetical protein
MPENNKRELAMRWVELEVELVSQARLRRDESRSKKN